MKDPQEFLEDLCRAWRLLVRLTVSGRLGREAWGQKNEESRLLQQLQACLSREEFDSAGPRLERARALAIRLDHGLEASDRESAVAAEALPKVQPTRPELFRRLGAGGASAARDEAACFRDAAAKLCEAASWLGSAQASNSIPEPVLRLARAAERNAKSKMFEEAAVEAALLLDLVRMEPVQVLKTCLASERPGAVDRLAAAAAAATERLGEVAADWGNFDPEAVKVLARCLEFFAELSRCHAAVKSIEQGLQKPKLPSLLQHRSKVGQMPVFETAIRAQYYLDKSAKGPQAASEVAPKTNSSQKVWAPGPWLEAFTTSALLSALSLVAVLPAAEASAVLSPAWAFLDSVGVPGAEALRPRLWALAGELGLLEERRITEACNEAIFARLLELSSAIRQEGLGRCAALYGAAFLTQRAQWTLRTRSLRGGSRVARSIRDEVAPFLRELASQDEASCGQEPPAPRRRRGHVEVEEVRTMRRGSVNWSAEAEVAWSQLRSTDSEGESEAGLD